MEYMTTLGKVLVLVGALIIIGLGYLSFMRVPQEQSRTAVDAEPQNMTLSGVYECLPHADTTGPQTEECAFGVRTDDGEYYAVNFGQSAGAMEQFKAGAHIVAEGFMIPKEALTDKTWDTYLMKGMFTVTKLMDSEPPMQGKLDITAVCQSALAYMTFADGASADAFVQACIEGKHPDVIDRYRKDMGLDDAAAL
jgi:hypothetical protein